jgi:branched-subunit amino acid transport protein AzlD
MTGIQAAILVAVMAACTFLTRALPFIIFSAHKRIPPFMSYLGKALPYSIIAMLIVYCLKDTRVLDSPHGLPELLAVCAVVLLYLWKRNSLVAIAGGTALYMFLAQNFL